MAGRESSGSEASDGPFTGGYYWLPRPTGEAVAWSVVTCRDLGREADDGHDAALWPRLMLPLAEAWGKDATSLKKALAQSYTGLPRGRVTRSGGRYLILHGDDSPAEGWKELVVAGFGLIGRNIRFLFDEHETPIPGHRGAVRLAIGWTG